jgi:hypothetical protein
MAAVTTKFRVWLQDRGIRPVWTGIKLLELPEYAGSTCLDVTVEGYGHELRWLIAKRPDIFAAYLQMKREEQ